METSGRQSDGTFAPGHKFSRGRPPRNYSIAHALSIAADTPQSIDDEGKPLTDAQLASLWLWSIVRTGLDERHTVDGGKAKTPVSTRDRLAALQTILSRIEPDYKLDPNKLDDDEAADICKRLDGLSESELAVLQKLGVAKQ